jgi:aspartate racemase
LRKLGIIGGTSWSSTALYYDYINRGIAQRLGGFHSARLTIESVDFADLIALEHADDWDGVAKLNIDAAQRLQAAGADGVLMACNTGLQYDPQSLRRGRGKRGRASAPYCRSNRG